MYKQNRTQLEKSKHPFFWIKRKIMILMAAFMMGISNAMYSENEMIHGNQHHTEQEQRKDE